MKVISSERLHDVEWSHMFCGATSVNQRNGDTFPGFGETSTLISEYIFHERRKNF
jgi:hypothetical protein